MKETNDLEMRFRSWRLRSPSARVRANIFSTASAGTAPAVEVTTPSFRLSWLAPATLAFLVLCVLFNQRNNPFPSTRGSGELISVALSNQSGASWLPGSFANEQNNIPAETFQFTNQRILERR